MKGDSWGAWERRPAQFCGQIVQQLPLLVYWQGVGSRFDFRQGVAALLAIAGWIVLAVNIFPVGNADHKNNQCLIVDLIYNPIIPNADTVGLFGSDNFSAPMGPGIEREFFESLEYGTQLGRGNFAEILFR